MKIYTRKGDEGRTSLLGGVRLDKDALRIEAYGTADELNSALGVVRSAAPPANLGPLLGRIQGELFELGARLACGSDSERRRHGGPGSDRVEALEAEIDGFEAELPPLQSFILPGGTAAAAGLHLARTVCRRAERRVVALEREEPFNRLGLAYLNRLGDWLFVAARLANFRQGVVDEPWSPKR